MIDKEKEEGKIIDIKRYGDYLIISYRTKYGIAFTKIKLSKYEEK